MPNDVSISSPSAFLLEEKRWLNWNSEIYSNYLPYYMTLAVALLFISFILTSPLSLIVTVPTLYYVTEVSKLNAWTCKTNNTSHLLTSFNQDTIHGL